MQQLGCLPLVRGVYGVRILIRFSWLRVSSRITGKAALNVTPQEMQGMGKFLAMGSKQRTPANPLSPYQLHNKKDHCSLLHDACLNRTSVFKKEASSKTETAEVICTPKGSEK